MFFDLVFHSLGRSERGGRASETFASPIWSRQTGFYNRLLLFFSPLSLFKIIYHLMLRKQSATEWAEVVGRDKQTTEQWPTQKKKRGKEEKEKAEQSRTESSRAALAYIHHKRCSCFRTRHLCQTPSITSRLNRPWSQLAISKN